MNIEVERLDGDLKRKVWGFHVYNNCFVLNYYAEQTRDSKRHKWQGPKWYSHDERCSQLDRPTEISYDVMQEAFKKLLDCGLRFYIGWFNEKHFYETVKLKETEDG